MRYAGEDIIAVEERWIRTKRKKIHTLFNARQKEMEA